MNYEQLAKKMLARAKKKGAQEAEVFMHVGREATCRARDGAVEALTEATARGVGVRVIVKKRLGFAWTTDFASGGLDAVVDKAVSLAESSAPNPLNGFAEKKDFATLPDVGPLSDEAIVNLDPEWKVKAAIELEKAARAFDPRITTIDSVEASENVGEVYFASSAGRVCSYSTTSVALVASPVAAEGAQLQTSYVYDVKRFLSDLMSPEEIGRESARRAVQLLGAKKVKSQKVPVVFEPRMAASFIASLAGAANGDAVFKKSSYLADKLKQRVAAPTVSIVNDGVMPKGLGTAPFDGEGVPRRVTPIIENGVLTAFLYDAFTARKAKTRTTGSASRGYRSLPSIGVHNLHLKPGSKTAEQIISEVPNGFYVTSMLGSGANQVTGQYSRGANGVWIENGELRGAVQEVTVAGNMLDMLQAIDAIGNDVEFRGSVGAPTIRFKELTVSGE